MTQEEARAHVRSVIDCIANRLAAKGIRIMEAGVAFRSEDPSGSPEDGWGISNGRGKLRLYTTFNQESGLLDAELELHLNDVDDALQITCSVEGGGRYWMHSASRTDLMRMVRRCFGPAGTGRRDTDRHHVAMRWIDEFAQAFLGT